MSPLSPLPHPPAAFEMQFMPLNARGRALSFPCDPHGQVDCDQLSPAALRSYLYARAMIGREFGLPRVCCTATV